MTIEIKEYNELSFDIVPPENYFSLMDLIRKGSGFVKMLKEKDLVSMTEFFYSLGVDVSKPIYLRNCKHRTRFSEEVVTTARYDYTERTDDEWINSPYASEKAKFSAIKDLSLKCEMLNMSKRVSVLDVEMKCKQKEVKINE